MSVLSCHDPLPTLGGLGAEYMLMKTNNTDLSLVGCVAAMLLSGCGNTVIYGGDGGSGGQGGASVSHGSSQSSSVAHSSSNNSVSVGQTGTSVVSSSNASVSVVSSSISTVSSNSVSVSSASTTVGSTSISSVSVSVSGSTSAMSSSGTGGAPPGWTCAEAFYAANDGCDCGCGVFDPDCSDPTSMPCVYCADPGACSMGNCPGNIDPMNNAICLPAQPEICGNGLDDDFDGLIDCADPDCVGQPGCAPLSWTCNPGYYKANDGCDCGCGAFDPDCPDVTSASCQFCGDPGSCDMSGNCPGNINPIKNAICN